MTKSKRTARATTSEVRAALRARFAAPAYALLEEVGNATGADCRRHADAVAMSLWPSRGLHLNGIEIKVSRQDWLKELGDPAKADSVARFCDFWWLAIGDESIVQPGELPPTWGLLVLEKGALRQAKEPTLLQPEPLSREFVAAMFRKASESVDMVRSEATSDGWKRGFEAGEKQATEPTALTRELEELRTTMQRFEEASGVKIANGWMAADIGQAVAEVLKIKRMRRAPVDELERAAKLMEKSASELREESEALRRATAIVQEGRQE